jgi:hypothetical protein
VSNNRLRSSGKETTARALVSLEKGAIRRAHEETVQVTTLDCAFACAGDIAESWGPPAGWFWAGSIHVNCDLSYRDMRWIMVMVANLRAFSEAGRQLNVAPRWRAKRVTQLARPQPDCGTRRHIGRSAALGGTASKDTTDLEKSLPPLQNRA